MILASEEGGLVEEASRTPAVSHSAALADCSPTERFATMPSGCPSYAIAWRPDLGTVAPLSRQNPVERAQGPRGGRLPAATSHQYCWSA